MQSLIDIRRELHKIPELGFQEFKTQAFILDYLAKLPGERLEITTWETGVVVKINGTNPTKTIGWRTDIDGLPVTEETGVDYTSLHVGNMHACGHDCHMTVALSLVTAFANNPPVHDSIEDIVLSENYIIKGKKFENVDVIYNFDDATFNFVSNINDTLVMIIDGNEQLVECEMSGKFILNYEGEILNLTLKTNDITIEYSGGKIDSD